MHNVRLYSITAILIHLCLAAGAAAQDNMVLGLHELTLRAQKSYAHPHRDVDVRCTFTGPNGAVYNVAGFWDGDSIWKVRFAPPTAGTWSWQTSASDPSDGGLHNLSGSFVVAEYVGSDPSRRHGWPRVSDNQRYLTYADGTPFFYLGDTAWEIAWKSVIEDARDYLDDRHQKGFTAVQIVPMSHQVFDTFGVVNRYGQTYLLNYDHSMLNPRYFDYLDSIVQMANERGITAVLVPMWAAMNELHFNPVYQRFAFTHDESMLIARYIGARYAGNNVMWIIGGDNVYDTPQRKAFWTEFAHVLDDASGRVHLKTSHPQGWTSSFDYWGSEATWLDFHMYQSSHTAGGDYTWSAGERASMLTPMKPTLNGEAVYEDIYHNLWAPGDTNHVDTRRIVPLDVRQANYESVLAGAIVGITYGGNGVWQWNVPTIWASHLPSHYVREAWQMPGSSQMTVFRQIMERVRWYQLRPRQDLNKAFNNTSENYLPIASTDSDLIVYVPAHTSSFALNLREYGSTIAMRMVNPATGVEGSTVALAIGEIGDSLTFIPPDTNDWVMIIRQATQSLVPIGKSGLYAAIAPNPVSDRAAEILVENDGQLRRLKIDVIDAIGRVVASDEVTVPISIGKNTLPLPVLQSGIYTVRLRRLDGRVGETWSERLVVQ